MHAKEDELAVQRADEWGGLHDLGCLSAWCLASAVGLGWRRVRDTPEPPGCQYGHAPVMHGETPNWGHREKGERRWPEK
jgi:hypothetical protein